jgi:CelD/BcsL family acetyltransferase involved in cellulose biosynthesis
VTPRLIRDEAGLGALEGAWWDLWRRVPGASPFTSPAWLLAWWRVFAPGKLFTAVVQEGDRLLALAPLYLEEGPRGRRLLPLGIALSDYFDALVDPAVPEAGAALLAALTAEGEAWDCFSAEELPPGSALLTLPPPAHWQASAAPQNACPVLDLSSGPAAPEAAIPAGKRRKLRMARHRTARRAWRIEVAEAGALDRQLEDLFRLHGARWDARGQGGVLADPSVRRFHALAAPALLRAGLLRLSLLRLDDAVAGVYYGFQHGANAYAYLGGFDPRFAFESPGTVLLGAALEAAAGEGATAFHFLRGQEAYKYEWGAQDRWNSRRIFEPQR